MKLIAIFSISFSCLFCAYSGNPSGPNAIEEGFIFSSGRGFNLKIGYEKSVTSDRRLNQKNSSRVNNFSQNLNLGMLTITILNRLDLAFAYGGGSIKTNWIINPAENTYSYLELETRNRENFAWSTKIIFLEWGKVNLSMGANYSYTKPSISWITSNESTFSLNNENLNYNQWQIDLGLSYKIDLFIPYISAKYSKAKAKFFIPNISVTSLESNTAHFKSRDNYGLVLGCSLTSSKYFMLNLEACLIDEETYTICGEFKF